MYLEMNELVFSDFFKTINSLAESKEFTKESEATLLNIAERFERSTNMMKKILDSSEVFLYICDYYTGEILMANERYTKYFGFMPEDAMGKKCWDLIQPGQESFCSFCPREKLIDSEGNPTEVYMWENYLPEFDMWLRITDEAIYWIDGRLAHMISFIDISEIRRTRDRLARLAFYDRSMQLPNLLKLCDDLQRWDKQSGVFLICFDIISLRNVNDAYGRTAGDALLESVTNWVLSLKSKRSRFYRDDGDDFGLVVRETTVENAEKIAKKIKERFEYAWSIKVDTETIQLFCGASIGVIDVAKHFDNPEDLSGLIERTLEFARKSDGIAIYDEAMDHEFKDHVKLEMSLKSCVRDGMKGFEVYYQPIIDPADGVWIGMEALCRWTSPEFGRIPPSVFIPEAEQLGLISTIGIWVLETAVNQCKQWGLDANQKFILDVNLSPTQLVDEEFIEKTIKILRDNLYPGRKLSLEVTESTEINLTNHTMDAIERLCALDIQMALDDFGTGYSSFNNLKKLPVSLLKIEREFIKDIEKDNYLQYLLHVMVDLAHTVDMKIIAEGVENRRQMEILIDNGVDFLQGYLFGKPQPSLEIEKRLENFKVSGETVYVGSIENITIKKLLDVRSNYSLEPSVYRLFNQCMQILTSSAHPDKSILRVLALLGKRLDFTRTSAFLKDDKGLYSCELEWYSDGSFPHKHYYQKMDFSEEVPSMIRLLRQDGIIAASDISLLPEDLYRILNEHEVKSAVILPIIEEAELVGILLLINSERHCEWPQEQLLLIHNLAMIIANLYRKRQLQSALESVSGTMFEIFDSMEFPIYISDVETDELLFANGVVRDMYGSEATVQTPKCYEVVRGEKKRCKDCKISRLKNSSWSGKYVWETFDKQARRHFKVYDCLIPWTDSGQAHLQYTVDITAIKEYQSKLEQAESIDAFTDTLNRSSIMQKLRSMLKKAHTFGEKLTICFVDVDRLKYTNDTFGHACGDMLLLKVVESLKRCVRKDDMIGRYGGDEFIVALTECDRQMTEQKISQARQSLINESENGEFLMSFSFGVVENFEIAFSDNEGYIKKLLEIADKRMLEYKRRVMAEK